MNAEFRPSWCNDSPELTQLADFFARMEAWEASAAAAYEDFDFETATREEFASLNKSIKDELRAIFVDLVDKGLEAARFDDAGLSFSEERPEYVAADLTLVELRRDGDDLVVRFADQTDSLYQHELRVTASGSTIKIRDMKHRILVTSGRKSKVRL